MNDAAVITDALVVPDGRIVTGDGGPRTCEIAVCAGKILECGDCIDNGDGDNEVDSADPECLGPCDNTEGPALEAGIGGGGGNTCKVDCYFDFGNGPGNDECHWDHRCDMLEPEGSLCPYTASMLGSNECPDMQDPLCAQICMPYTPNGCDCFGCCEFPTAGPGDTPRNVWIGAIDSHNDGTCTFTDIKDPVKCPTCTPVANCFNPCDQCETCIGKPPPPPGTCTPGERCSGGQQPCGLPTDDLCRPDYYCISGCCILIIE